MSGVPVTTLRRWRRWWREMFPRTRAWRVKRGELAAPPGEAPLVFLTNNFALPAMTVADIDRSRWQVKLFQLDQAAPANEVVLRHHGKTR